MKSSTSHNISTNQQPSHPLKETNSTPRDPRNNFIQLNNRIQTNINQQIQIQQVQIKEPLIPQISNPSFRDLVTRLLLRPIGTIL